MYPRNNQGVKKTPEVLTKFVHVAHIGPNSNNTGVRYFNKPVFFSFYTAWMIDMILVIQVKLNFIVID